MVWNKLSLEVTALQADAVESMLWDLGAVSVTLTDSLDDPIFEPPLGEHPLWAHSELSALFEQDIDLMQVVETLSAEVGGQVHIETLVERAWEREWLDQFKPMPFGKRLWVVPTAYDPPAEAEVVLTLDPGLAFGTGTHATTAKMLLWLDRTELKGQRILDYGCGSGILGIAALLLGAGLVSAVDIDPQAVQATRENAVMNCVDERLTVAQVGELDTANHDVVLANILAEPLCELVTELCHSTKKGGTLVLSGILDSQRAQIEQAYEGHASVIEEFEQEGWVALVLRRS